MSRLCWDMVRQRHDIEEQHYVLHVPIPEITQDEYLAAEPRLFDELRRVGLADGPRIHSGLPAAMRLLARPKVDLHGWIGYHDGSTIGVVAASDGREHAVLAALGDQSVHLRRIRPDRLVPAVVGLLPPMDAARAQSLTVPVDAYQSMMDSRQDGDRDVGGWLQDNTPADRLDEELAAMRRLMSLPRLGGGRFHAAARDDVGRRTKSRHPITYLELAAGRWIVRQKPDDMGHPWVVAVPAATEFLADALTGLLGEVLSQRRRRGV